MSLERPLQLEKNIVTITFGYVFLLYFAWVGAWLLAMWLEQHTILLNSQLSKVAYWFVMKVLLWILPSLYLIKLSGRSFKEVLGLNQGQSILLIGGGTGLVLGFITITIHLSTKVDFDWSFLSGVILSPILEEITFRGAVMGALQKRFKFSIANLLTGVLFLGMHIPGWYFQGQLALNLIMPIGGALSILLIGLLLGYVAHKSKSVAASILAHILNNFFSI